MWKDTWYQKTFEECREIRKIKMHMWNVWLLTCPQALNMKKKKKIKYKSINEMKC